VPHPHVGYNLGMAAKRSIGSEMVARRYAKMTPEERSAAARNAAVKRWAAVKKKAGKAGKKEK
jgi:hypothetical protein